MKLNVLLWKCYAKEEISVVKLAGFETHGDLKNADYKVRLSDTIL